MEDDKTLKIDASVHEKLKEHTDAKGIKMNFFAEQAILEKMEREKQFDLLKEAQKI